MAILARIAATQIMMELDDPAHWKRRGHLPMQDMQAHLEKLRAQIVECDHLQATAKSKIKRNIFARLAAHYEALARELEAAIAAVSEPIPDTLLGRKTCEPFYKSNEE